MNRRGRLRRIGAALAAVAAAIVPGAARATALALPEAVEAEVSGTAPERLLELAHRHPEQVLSNRELRRLRAQDPDAHRDIVLAARCARAEIALAKTMAKAAEPTLRVFACDCAARVLPLYTRVGRSADMFDRGAMSALGDLVFARVERHVADLEAEVAGRGAATRPEQPLRMLTVAMKAAEAIDQALLVAVGGRLSRIDGVCEAIAEAVYLDNAFRGSGRAAALDAVFRELDWQRRHLRALLLSTV